ncbi:serine hydrolase [Brachybacterium sp. FME24]|uniref:serine hydrolase domain-containing protein n=1 Tax=Brachybacterium sp. FME24 TaxID=2742605 RepID=UPI001869346A|nr:serine hydrolase domain-containing protein [Brachybacterium sp. FME24]
MTTQHPRDPIGSASAGGAPPPSVDRSASDGESESGPGAAQDATSPHIPAPSRRAVFAGAAGAGAVLAVTAVTAGPRPPRLGPVGGDEELAAELRPYLGGHHRVSVVVIDGEQHRFAAFGADENTEFEIGSVTKTFTGALLMDAVERGEVTLDTTVTEILGERAHGSDAADVTLAELASQSSGLPRLPVRRLLASFPMIVLRKDSYLGTSAEDVIDAALGATLRDRGDYAYSNLGVALLGQLLAVRAEATWQELLGARLLDPLGMTSTRAPFHLADVGEDAPRGRTSSGLSAGAWTMHGYGPAGAIRSTAADMGRYLRSLQEGSNPGAAGLEPLVDRGEGRSVGVVWGLNQTDDGDTLVQHNGMTGGFSAFCGFNRDTGRGVALLTASARDLDDLGAAIIDGSVPL